MEEMLQQLTGGRQTIIYRVSTSFNYIVSTILLVRILQPYHFTPSRTFQVSPGGVLVRWAFRGPLPAAGSHATGGDHRWDSFCEFHMIQPQLDGFHSEICNHLNLDFNHDVFNQAFKDWDFDHGKWGFWTMKHGNVTIDAGIIRTQKQRFFVKKRRDLSIVNTHFNNGTRWCIYIYNICNIYIYNICNI